jgi:hypothetical protein
VTGAKQFAGSKTNKKEIPGATASTTAAPTEAGVQGKTDVFFRGEVFFS